MAISPENAIQQLRDAFPDKYKFATDEEVYRIARNKYPDAPIQDWQKIGYKSIPKIKEDPFDVNLERTDETTFLDHFNIYGIDEDSSYLARLAYTRSLQGMASDVLRGKPKFTFDEQPSLFSEAIAGIMSFAMPLDALSLFGGGGIFGKAVLSTGGAKAATKYLSKKVLKVAPGMAKAPGGRAAVETSIRNIIGNEMMYVPYEGAKANMFARTEHMRNPDMDPLSSQDILKETFAGIVHGGIMGVMGGSTRPFLAARHSRLLKTIDNFEAQKKLTGASQGRLLKLKDKLKYTGAYSQYATDVAGLTLGDITGTAVAYGQIKSGEEMMASLLTMGGFAGATRVAGLGLNKVVMEPLEKAQSEYKKKFEIRKKQLDKEEAIQNSVNSKSKEQLDTDAEQQATQNSFENMSDLDDRRKAFDESEAGMRFKEIENKVKAFKELADDDIDDPKKALKFYEKRMEMFAEVKDYLEGAEVMFDDVVRLEKWMDEGLENATKSLGIQRDSIADNISTRITQIRTRLDKAGRPDTIPIELADGTFKDTPIMNIQDELSKKGLSGDELNQEFLRILDSTEKTLSNIPTEKESLRLDATESTYVKTQKTVGELEESLKDVDPKDKRLIESYNENIKTIKEIDNIINELDNKNLSDVQKESIKANYQIIKTFISSDGWLLKRAMKGGGGKAGPLLINDTRKARLKGMLEFVNRIAEERPDLKIRDLDRSFVQEITGKMTEAKRIGIQDLFGDLKTQDLLSVDLKRLAKPGAISKQTPRPIDPGDPVGLRDNQINKNSINIKMPKAAGAPKTLPFVTSVGNVITKIKKLINKKTNQIKGGDGKLNKVVFFAKQKVGNAKDGYKFKNVAIESDTLTELSKGLFGIDGQAFRKGFFTYVNKKYKVGSEEANIVEIFGLGHDGKQLTTKEALAYMTNLKKDKSGGMMKSTQIKYEKLAKEYFGLVFDKRTSSQLKQLADKKPGQLKKYFLEAKALEEDNVPTIYTLKKGFENIEKIKAAADKDGFINFTNKGDLSKNISEVSYKIHKDVLEGAFKIHLETNARIGELFAKKGRVDIPVSGKPMALKSEALNSLISKLNLGATLDNPLKDVKLEEINIEYQSRDKLRKNSLTKNSTDNLNTLKVKARLVMTGGRFGDFSRMALGDAKYEKQLKSILKTYGMTDADIKKMKKISLEDDMVDEAILTRILNDMECR
tara:strand:- start:3101 stop:6691 length:3591 start_codon:yes stop_codon:yes gene_type:complete